MTTTNNNSTNPVNTLVKIFQDTLPESIKNQREFQVRGYRVLWQQIAEAFFVAQKIRQQNKDDLKAAFVERKISVSTKADANPYLPIVRLLYGQWKDEDGTVFEPNRSAEKYACVFRYLNKRKNQFKDVTSIVDHIEETLGHLKGIEEADRAANKSKATKTTSDEALKAGLKVSGAMEIGSVEDVAASIDGFKSDASQGQIWFKVADGKVYLMGFKALEDDARDNLAKKRGKNIIEAAANAAKAKVLEAA